MLWTTVGQEIWERREASPASGLRLKYEPASYGLLQGSRSVSEARHEGSHPPNLYRALLEHVDPQRGTRVRHTETRVGKQLGLAL
jgi:hypothetical protein